MPRRGNRGLAESVEEIERTAHGENIGDQIAGADAYGEESELNAADVLYIIDNVHTNVLDGNDPNKDRLSIILSKWMDQMHKEFPNMEVA